MNLHKVRTELRERSIVAGNALRGRQVARVSSLVRLDKYDENMRLVETVEREGNLLMYGGVSTLWECLIGNGTGTASQTLTYFNNGNAYIGVGDSTTAVAATQTDLQASSNKTRIAMNSTYPQHTDATTSGAASISFQVTATSGVANYAWNEWGIFNGSSGGRMLNRKQESLGTKASGATWVLTVTPSIA